MFSDRSEEETSEKFPSLKQAVSERMVSRFPVKLWRITNECKSGAISWHKKGHSIRINKADFEKQYLGNPSSSKDDQGGIVNSRSSFKTKHFRSFVRQLNMYGFRKISHSRNMKINKICCPTNNRSFPPAHSYSQMNTFHNCLLDPHSNMNVENNNSHDRENIYADNDVSTELHDVNGRSAVIYEYCHPFFQQDHPELLFQIQRPKKKHLDTENLLALAQCAIEDSLLSGNSWEPLQCMRLMPSKESSAPEEQNNTSIPQLLNSEPPTVNISPPEPVTTSSIYQPVPVSAHDGNVIQDSWSEHTVRILASSNDDNTSIMAPAVCSAGYVSPNFSKEVWLSSLPMEPSKANYLISPGTSMDGDQAFMSGKDASKGRYCYDQFYQSPVDVGQVTAALNTGAEILTSCPEQDVTPNSMWKGNTESIAPLYNSVANHFKHSTLNIPDENTFSDIPQYININSSDGNSSEHCPSQVWLLS